MSDLATILLISTAAAVASPVGGAIAAWRKPTTLFMSASLGFAGGTTAEELIEGLSIGEIIRDQQHPGAIPRIMGWTGAIGVALLGAAIAGCGPCSAACRPPSWAASSSSAAAGCST